MLRKWYQMALAIMFVAIMIFPNAPATALGSLPPDTEIAHHALTGMVSFMGSPDAGSPI